MLVSFQSQPIRTRTSCRRRLHRHGHPCRYFPGTMHMITTMKISLLLLLVLILTMSSSSCVSFFVRGEDDSADVLAVLAEESVPSGEQQEQEAMPAEVEAGANQQEVPAEKQDKEEEPLQTGPLVDLLGPKLYSLQMVNEQQAQINEHLTTDALRKKDVIGLYFSADWCGPCRQFTPELVKFYEKMNKRTNGSFEIVWISRCRDTNSYVNYFAHMPWLAIPPEEALGERGEFLGKKYGVKGIPSLVLLDDLGQTITTDARNKIPQDRNGIGFPWRNPISQMYSMLVPRSVRMLVKLQIDSFRKRIVQQAKGLIGLGRGGGSATRSSNGARPSTAIA